MQASTSYIAFNSSPSQNFIGNQKLGIIWVLFQVEEPIAHTRYEGEFMIYEIQYLALAVDMIYELISYKNT
jgi:hypothetical protein